MHEAHLSDLEISENSPSNRLFRKMRLERDDDTSVIRKILLFSMITWLPLLIITYFEGNALNNNIKIPFLYDYVTYTRFLISLPLLLIAEKLTRIEVKQSVLHFASSG